MQNHLQLYSDLVNTIQIEESFQNENWTAKLISLHIAIILMILKLMFMKQEITVAYKTTQTLKQLLDLKDNFEDFRKSRMYEIL